jgi:transposase-like protein
MVETTAVIVDVSVVSRQAWIGKGIPAIRQEIEEQLIQARTRQLEIERAAGRHAVAWGYHVRKTWGTPWGDLGPIRIPRLRVEEREVRLFPRQMRRIESLDRMAAEATIGGVSQRRIDGLLWGATGQSMSAATVGRVLAGLGGAVGELKGAPLSPGKYCALALDAVWCRYRGRGQAALAAAVGVRRDGVFDVLDWEAGESESGRLYEGLLTRLWERGLRGVELVVGDGAGGIESGRQMVYPEAEFQLCLWHLWRTLKGQIGWAEQRAFSRDFWEVYNGLSRSEVRARMQSFRRVWGAREPQMLEAFDGERERTLGFLRFPAQWRHRVRTVNLAEGFFRNLRRFLSRWPGFLDEAHLSHVIGLYLLGTRPQAWRRPVMHLAA